MTMGKDGLNNTCVDIGVGFLNNHTDTEDELS